MAFTFRCDENEQVRIIKFSDLKRASLADRRTLKHKTVWLGEERWKENNQKQENSPYPSQDLWRVKINSYSPKEQVAHF